MYVISLIVSDQNNKRTSFIVYLATVNCFFGVVVEVIALIRGVYWRCWICLQEQKKIKSRMCYTYYSCGAIWKVKGGGCDGYSDFTFWECMIVYERQSYQREWRSCSHHYHNRNCHRNHLHPVTHYSTNEASRSCNHVIYRTHIAFNYNANTHITPFTIICHIYPVI